MYLLAILLFLILLLVILISIIPLKIAIIINSEKAPYFNIIASWLYPFFKIVVCNDDKFILQFYIFKKNIFNKILSSKNFLNEKQMDTNKFTLIKNVKPQYIGFKANYCFEDPSITGMVCGSINVLSEYLQFDNLVNNPTFDKDFDFYNIEFILKINIVILLLTLYRSKSKDSHISVLHTSK